MRGASFLIGGGGGAAGGGRGFGGGGGGGGVWAFGMSVIKLSVTLIR